MKMLFAKTMALAIGFILVSVTFLGAAWAGETLLSELDIEASGSLDVYNRYVWRGFTLDTDPVVQPGFSLSGYGVTASFWGSWDADNNDASNSDEVDFVVDYTKEFDDFSVSLGHTYYDFPGSSLYSREFYLGIAMSDFPLSPSLTYYHDYGDEDNGGGDGDYAVLSLSQGFDLVEEYGITLDLGASVGYNHELFITGDGGDFLGSIGLTVPLTENLTMCPSVNYAVPFSDLSDSNDGNQDNRFYAGVSLGYSF